MKTPVQGQKTAIRRNRPSAPARLLHERGLLRGRCLDYGCGKGDDVEAYGMTGWDPAHRPRRPRGRFDTVTCSYVLNVVDPEDVPYILKDIRSLLRRRGRAYIAVRRDLGGKSRPGNGTTQWHVELDLPLVYQRSGQFAIYEMRG